MLQHKSKFKGNCTQKIKERAAKKIERKERKGLAKPFSNTIVLFQNYFGWLGFNSNKKRRGGFIIKPYEQELKYILIQIILDLIKTCKVKMHDDA
jgi:hypothetical protein